MKLQLLQPISDNIQLIIDISAETKYFICSCPRCVDPTELGTMFSSIRCPQCTADTGYLVPNTPGHADLLEVQADWRCVSCSKTQPAKFVNAVTQVSLSSP